LSLDYKAGPVARWTPALYRDFPARRGRRRLSSKGDVDFEAGHAHLLSGFELWRSATEKTKMRAETQSGCGPDMIAFPAS
jgi:hypothetical protein